MWGISFGEFQCLPVDDCSAVSCDSGDLARGSECTYLYSAILNQSSLLWFSVEEEIQRLREIRMLEWICHLRPIHLHWEGPEYMLSQLL